MASIESLFNSLFNSLLKTFGILWHSVKIVMFLSITLQLFFVRQTEIISWCKWTCAFAYSLAFKLLKKTRFNWYKVEVKNDPIKTGFLTPPEEGILESPASEIDLLTDSDEVFFYGVNSNSQSLVIRLVRGCNKEAEAWIHLQMGNGKTYSLKETSGIQQSTSDGRVFSCGDLQMHYLSPMRKWRIFFNGLLREESDDDSSSEKMVYVKFVLLWHASSDPFDSLRDIKAVDLAKGLSKAEWNSCVPPLKKLNKALDFYAQPGAITGIVTIDEQDHEVYLFGERMRFLGDILFQCDAEVQHLFGQIQKNGRRVHLIEVSIPSVVDKLRFGYIVQPSAVMDTISGFKADGLKNFIHEDSNQNYVRAKFQADGDRYELISRFEKEYRFPSDDGSSQFAFSCIDFEMNSISGKGVVLKRNIMKPKDRPEIMLEVLPSISEVSPLVLHFSDVLCQESHLTGGKGSSLGKLTELSNDFQNFTVPKGVVVTTFAYENFATNEILNNAKILESVLYGNVSGDVKAACQKIIDEIMISSIPEQVYLAIVANLQRAFPGEEPIKYAVRSSATGEDTDQMSAAGQMSTYLGVTGLSEIMNAVKKCWASQFSYTAVQYKRQYGQVINSPMAVVIQEMIPCDVAGVLFTCDPLTGNPTSMCITANYGLGESVVSGTEEPDTIEIKRSVDEGLTIKTKDIGSKSRRIVIKDDKGTTVEDVSEEERQTCCLTDEMALTLGSLAVKIEKSYRSKRDIEWGFLNNNLYIFQSRPVTSGMEESDYEIEHEMDYPMRSEDEYFSVGNIGEVLPGAVSTLGDDLLGKMNRIVFRQKKFSDWQVAVRGNYYSGGMITMCGHKMFYSLDLLDRVIVNREAAEMSSMGLFGRIIKDEEMYDSAKERHSQIRKNESFTTQATRLIRAFYLSNGILKKCQKHYADYRLSTEDYTTSRKLFKYLTLKCTDLSQAVSSHSICTEASGVCNMFALSILKAANGGDIDTNVYNEFARIATTDSDVESADVPSALEKLVSWISKDLKPEEFKKMNLNEAVNYLETSNSVSGRKYREFIVKHGHRCLKETDIYSEPWESNPKNLVQLLQSMIKSASNDKVDRKIESVNELMSTLKVPLSKIGRLVLKLIIPQLRKAIRNREASKSVVVKGINEWRKGYSKLSQVMVSEGRIPDADILFFMNLDEVKLLLDTRSPKIIAKAIHRRRRFPIVDKYIYPELKKGFPRPINIGDTSLVVNEEGFSMTGVPVSRGVVTGFVRVALTVEEASHLKHGEILITYCTDIGWSPYFPILAGVVTELGGLLSHGAVVSREYGIPCIVALHGARQQFQTGDYALLDGNKGVLQKLPQPVNENA